MPGKHSRKTRGSPHDRMVEKAAGITRKRSSQAARRTGSVRASMPNRSTSKPKSSKTKIVIGRDKKTGKFVSLQDASRRGNAVAIESFTPTRRKAKS